MEENNLIEVEIDESTKYTPISDDEIKDVHNRLQYSTHLGRSVDQYLNYKLPKNEKLTKHINIFIKHSINNPNVKVYIPTNIFIHHRKYSSNFTDLGAYLKQEINNHKFKNNFKIINIKQNLYIKYTL